MASAFHHAVSSQRKWGGVAADYLAIHQWFDETKNHHGDFRHRALRHHTLGIAMCEEVFGISITNSDGRELPVRWIAEQHLIEDFGHLPPLTDWLREIRPQPWMSRARALSRDLERSVTGSRAD